MVLVINNEQDIIDSLEEELNMCMLHKASEYNTALAYLENRFFDIVILDIDRVNGPQLLEKSLSRGFITVILLRHTIDKDALKKYRDLGALLFIKKEKLSEIRTVLEDALRDTMIPELSSS